MPSSSRSEKLRSSSNASFSSSFSLHSCRFWLSRRLRCAAASIFSWTEGIFFFSSAFSSSSTAFFFFRSTTVCFAAASVIATSFSCRIWSTVTPLTAPVSVFSGWMVSKSTRTRSAAFSAATVPESDLISPFSSVFFSCISASSCKAAAVCSCTASASWIAARYSGSSMCRRLLPREIISNSCC